MKKITLDASAIRPNQNWLGEDARNLSATLRADFWLTVESYIASTRLATYVSSGWLSVLRVVFRSAAGMRSGEGGRRPAKPASAGRSRAEPRTRQPASKRVTAPGRDTRSERSPERIRPPDRRSAPRRHPGREGLPGREEQWHLGQRASRGGSWRSRPGWLRRGRCRRRRR